MCEVWFWALNGRSQWLDILRGGRVCERVECYTCSEPLYDLRGIKHVMNGLIMSFDIHHKRTINARLHSSSIKACCAAFLDNILCIAKIYWVKTESNYPCHTHNQNRFIVTQMFICFITLLAEHALLLGISNTWHLLGPGYSCHYLSSECSVWKWFIKLRHWNSMVVRGWGFLHSNFESGKIFMHCMPPPWDICTQGWLGNKPSYVI